MRIIPAAHPLDLANILSACGELRWSPGRRVVAAAVAAMRDRLENEPDVGLHALRRGLLGRTLWGLAALQELGVPTPARLPALLSACKRAAWQREGLLQDATLWAGMLATTGQRLPQDQLDMLLLNISHYPQYLGQREAQRLPARPGAAGSAAGQGVRASCSCLCFLLHCPL